MAAFYELFCVRFCADPLWGVILCKDEYSIMQRLQLPLPQHYRAVTLSRRLISAVSGAGKVLSIESAAVSELVANLDDSLKAIP